MTHHMRKIFSDVFGAKCGRDLLNVLAILRGGGEGQCQGLQLGAPVPRNIHQM